MPDPFTQLLEWRRNEAAGRGLSKLPPEFLSSTATYLGELRRSYESDLRENPSGRKGEISRQTYQRAGQVARDIIEGRVQKLLALAFQASIGGSREIGNALPEERAIFDRLLATLLEYRRAFAPYLDPVGAEAAPPTAAGVRPSPPGPPPAPGVASAPVPSSAARAPAVGGPLAYVRLVKDGRPVNLGTETIDLRAGDLVSLAPAAAKLLVDTKVAEPITPGPLPQG